MTEPAAASPVMIPRSRVLNLGSAGRPDLALWVAWPEGPPPPGGHPLLLLLDGEACFATAAEAARLQARRPEVTGVAPAVIAALSHTTGPAAREADFTPPGAGAFLDLLEQAVLPLLAAVCPCDPVRRALFGHSLGGLLAVQALFRRPGLFRRHVAASPSLWWGGRAVLQEAEGFVADPPPGAPELGLLMLTGALESDDPSLPPARRARLAERRMGANARELVALLGTLGPRAPRIRFVELPDENHASILPAAISRALRFVLDPTA